MRYSKQDKFHPMKDSSKILKHKTVAIVGLGGLGSHSSEYMTRMGVGNIILIDDDFVEESNLARQGLYTYLDSKNFTLKSKKAKQQLTEINPEINISIHSLRLNKSNTQAILNGVDVVLDGTDNLTTRYLINDFCFDNGIPWIYAAATGSVGVVSNYIPGITPCFRCIYGDVLEDNASCDSSGIILPALTMITSLQVTEAMKILLGKEPILDELRFNIWTREETSIDTSVFFDESCRCHQNKIETKKTSMYMICSGDSIQVHTDIPFEDMGKIFSEWGFVYSDNTLNNDLFTQAKRKKTDSSLEIQRIVGYKTGKILFYNIDKEQILEWLQ